MGMLDGYGVDETGAAYGTNPASVVKAPYVGPTSDPFLNFTSTGKNRNALYGAYLWDAPIVTQTQNMFGGPIVDETGATAQTMGAGKYTFANHLGIPDLSQWSGQELGDSGMFNGPVSEQSAAEAQAILHKFFPNVSQEQLDRAAYAAQQSGKRYTNGVNGEPMTETTSPYYYGWGPMPLVIGVANELGGVPPALADYANQNWASTAARYANARKGAKSAADAASTSDALGIAGGMASVFGPALGGASGLFDMISGAMGGGSNAGLGALNSFDNGAMASALGGGSGAAAAAGSGAMDWTDWLNSLGDWGFDGATGGSSVSDLTNAANQFGWSDLASAGTSAGANADIGGSSWINTLIEQAKADPLGTAAKVVKSLGGAGGLLGTAAGGLLGSVNGSKQAGTTTTTQAPWGPQQPYLLDAFQKAQQAANGSPLQTSADANYQSVLSGPTKNPYLGMDNPYLTKAIDYANEDVTRAMMPVMNQANRASGSFGNSGVADQFGTAMANQYGKNATGMRMQDYTNQQQLAQQNVQNTLGFTTGTSSYTSAPSQNYAKTVQGSYGGATTSPYYNNDMANILGGALAGNKIGSNLGF